MFSFFKDTCIFEAILFLNTLSLTRAGTIMKGKMKRKSSSRDKRADNCLFCPLEIILRVENISSHLLEWLATECWLCHKRLPIHSSVHFSKEISVLHVLQVSFTEQLLSNILPLLSLSLSWSGCFVPGWRICYRQVFQKVWVHRSTAILKLKRLHSSSDCITGCPMTTAPPFQG